MSAESVEGQRRVAPHWKLAGLFAGGLAAGCVLVQERERMAGALANVQDTLTNNGLAMIQKLSGMADAFVAKVHETFIAAAPPTSLEAAVRQGLTGQLEASVTTNEPQGRTQMLRNRPRSKDNDADDEDRGDPPYEEEIRHRTRRPRHTGPGQDDTPLQLRHPSRPAGAAASRDWQASLHAQEAGVDEQSNEAVLLSPSESMGTSDSSVAATVAANDARAQATSDVLIATRTAAIARAQVDPAGLIGARLSATWIDETFTCEVMMIREGLGGKFETLVKYDADQVEQWVVIGEPPYCHTLVDEATETWMRIDNAFIGARTLKCIGSRE